MDEKICMDVQNGLYIDWKRKEIVGSDNNVEDIVIPQGIVLIKDCAFKNNKKVKTLVIPDGITNIGKGAFSGCSKLTAISLPNNLKTISNKVFKRCSSLTSVIIPKDVTYIGKGAFAGCSSLADIVIPESVKYIGDGAFAGCSSLTSVIMPESVKYVGDGLFAECSNLVAVTIPDDVEHIGRNVFLHCSNLLNINGIGMKETASDKDFEYEFNHLYLLNTDNTKKLYSICTEGLVEPKYVDFKWKYAYGCVITRQYTFFDLFGRKRKEVFIDESGVLSCVLLYNWNGNCYYEANISYNYPGKTVLIKYYFDGSDKSKIIKKESMFVD